MVIGQAETDDSELSNFDDLVLGFYSSHVYATGLQNTENICRDQRSKGYTWEGVRGPEADTRDITANVYICQVEKIDGRKENVVGVRTPTLFFSAAAESRFSQPSWGTVRRRRTCSARCPWSPAAIRRTADPRYEIPSPSPQRYG